MRVYLAGRHYIYSVPTVKILEEALSKLQKSMPVLNSFSDKFNLSLLISINKLTVPQEVLERTERAVSEIRKLGIQVIYAEKATVAGIKFIEQLFEGKEKLDSQSIHGLFDLDQFSVYRKEDVETIINLAEKMQHEGSLYTNASRDVPIILGVNTHASNLRAIHEIIHSMIPESLPFRVVNAKHPAKISPAYKEFGDSTSGFYLVNPQHSKYEELKMEVHKYPQLYNVHGFSIEYFTSLWTAINAKLSTGYVPSYTNPYYINPSPEEETAKALDYISTTTHLLSKTSIGEYVKNRLKNTDYFVSKLSPFFDKRDIEAVINAMHAGLNL